MELPRVALAFAIAVTAACSSVPAGPTWEGNTCALPDSSGAPSSVGGDVVRVVSGKQSGSGFVLKTPRTAEVLVVTNHHLVAESRVPTVTFGGTASASAFEVVKVDDKNDLALLRGSAAKGDQRGWLLEVRAQPVIARIAAFGDREPKPPTAKVLPKRMTLNDRVILSLEAPVDPGLTGAPLVDACGMVVGVVAATTIEAERIGLGVPAEHVANLYERYAAPAPAPGEGMRALLARLERALMLRDDEAGGQLFSIAYLETTVEQDFTAFLSRADTWEAKGREMLSEEGIDYASAPYKQKAEFLRERLSPDEYLGWTLKHAIAVGNVGPYQAKRLYLSRWILGVFGRATSMKVLGLPIASEGEGSVAIEIENERGVARHELKTIFERGDWRIEAMRCTQGCTDEKN